MKSTKQKRIYNFLIVALIAVILVSGGYLVFYFAQAKATANLYDDLADQVELHQTVPQTSGDDGIPASTDFVPNRQALVEAVNADTGESIPVLPEYKEIYERNSDTVGWIRISDTPVNYPVMQKKDSENYYLYRDFYRNDNHRGCIYAGEACDIDRPSDQVVLYGHWTRNRSMFGSLQSYKEEAYLAEHPIIQFDTLTEHHTYEIFCVFRTTASSGKGFRYNLFVNAENQNDFHSYLQRCHSLQMYDTGKTAQYGDKLLALSTCEYSQPNGRLVILAKRVS